MPLPGMPNLNSDIEDHDSSLISPTLGAPSKDGASSLEDDEFDLQAPEHVKPMMNEPEDTMRSFVTTKKIVKDGIQVVATRLAFYNQTRIKDGDLVTIKSTDDFGEWMRCVDPDFEKQRLEFLRNKKAKK